MSQTTAIAYLPDFSPKGTVDNSTSRTTELRMLFDQLRQLMDCIKIPDTSGNCRYCLQTRSLNRQPLQGFHHTLHRPLSGSFPVFRKSDLEVAPSITAAKAGLIKIASSLSVSACFPFRNDSTTSKSLFLQNSFVSHSYNL